MTIAFIFPGQGSQSVGMGKSIVENFPAAKETIEEVNELLKRRLDKLIFEGPLDSLTLTENAQPALLAISMAILRAIEQESGQKGWEMVHCMAGHSLGEYTALCALESLTLKESIQLVRSRGQAMQKAVKPGIGAMAALIGLDIEKIEPLVEPFQSPHALCVIANDNSPGQTVISGHKEAVEEVMVKALEAGAKKTVSLPVSGPFHSPLMESAAHTMEEAFLDVSFKPLKKPFISNVTASLVNDDHAIPSLLVKQITGRVRWRESILEMANHHLVDCIIEVGPGTVLTGLTRRICPSVKAFTINEPKHIEALLELLH